MVALLGQHTGSERKAFSKERPFSLSFASTAGILLTVDAGWSSVSTRRMLGLGAADCRRCSSSGDPHAVAKRSDRSKQATGFRVTPVKTTTLPLLSPGRRAPERAFKQRDTGSRGRPKYHPLCASWSTTYSHVAYVLPPGLDP